MCNTVRPEGALPTVITRPPAPAPPRSPAARRSSPSTVHLDSRGQRGTSLLPLAGRGIQRAQATVAVGLERAHAELLGQGEGLAVVIFGLIAVRRLTPRRHVAEEAQGIRLVAAFLVRTGERQGALGEGVRLLQAPSQELRLPQGEATERLKATVSPAVVCSGACVRSGTASATRPARVYAAPKAPPPRGNGW